MNNDLYGLTLLVFGLVALFWLPLPRRTNRTGRKTIRAASPVP
jgi:hypothetical protein